MPIIMAFLGAVLAFAFRGLIYFLSACVRAHSKESETAILNSEIKSAAICFAAVVWLVVLYSLIKAIIINSS